jgi:hypothetical protein
MLEILVPGEVGAAAAAATQSERAASDTVWWLRTAQLLFLVQFRELI